MVYIYISAFKAGHLGIVEKHMVYHALPTATQVTIAAVAEGLTQASKQVRCFVDWLGLAWRRFTLKKKSQLERIKQILDIFFHVEGKVWKLC